MKQHELGSLVLPIQTGTVVDLRQNQLFKHTTLIKWSPAEEIKWMDPGALHCHRLECDLLKPPADKAGPSGIFIPAWIFVSDAAFLFVRPKNTFIIPLKNTSTVRWDSCDLVQNNKKLLQTSRLIRPIHKSLKK